MTRGAQDRADLLLVCSAGGHLLDMLALEPAWSDHSRRWVSFDKSDVRSLLAGERVVLAHGPTNRSVQNLLRNTVLAWRTLGRVRPRVVVTTGAGVGVPFAWVGRARGARVAYVECAGRVGGPSLSLRMIAPVADRVWVQWPEIVDRVRKARFGGNWLHHVPEGLRPRRDGAQPYRDVFVTLGTNEARFDRLLDALAALPAPLRRRLVVQHGASPVRVPDARCHEFLSFERFRAEIAAARAVVTHAGIGSIALAIAAGLRPVVMPRRADLGEAVDDHQIAFARRLDEAGLVTMVEDSAKLRAALERADTPATTPGPPWTLTGELAEFLSAGVPAASRR